MHENGGSGTVCGAQSTAFLCGGCRRLVVAVKVVKHCGRLPRSGRRSQGVCEGGKASLGDACDVGRVRIGDGYGAVVVAVGETSQGEVGNHRKGFMLYN